MLLALGGCLSGETDTLKNKLKKQRTENQSLQTEISRLNAELETLRNQAKAQQRDMRALKDQALAAQGREINSQKICAEHTQQLNQEVAKLKERAEKQAHANENTCRHEATAVIHYHRPDGKYHQWGVHLWGEAVVEPTSWSDPRMLNNKDAFGVYAKVPIRPDSMDKELWFIIHREAAKSINKDLYFIPKQTPEVWMIHGDATIYTSYEDAKVKTKK
jgi:seryl-tRNA synthetase